MNWDAIGAIGQMLGSIAVFVTLGYLALQVRHARAEMRRSISQSRSEAIRELCMNRANNALLNSTFGKANSALAATRKLTPFLERMEQAGLSIAEATTLLYDQWSFWHYRAQIVAYVHELPPGERLEFDQSIQSNYRDLPLARSWYETHKITLNPDTVRYIDNLLAHPA